MKTSQKYYLLLFLFISWIMASCSSNTEKKAKDLSKSIEQDINQTSKKVEKIGKDLGKTGKKIGKDIGDGTKKGLHSLKKTGDTVAHKLRLEN